MKSLTETTGDRGGFREDIKTGSDMLKKSKTIQMLHGLGKIFITY